MPSHRWLGFHDKANAGVWYDIPVYDSGSDTTTFYGEAWNIGGTTAMEEQGTTLVPDIQKPVHLTILSITVNTGADNDEIVVRGRADDLASNGDRFFIQVPPRFVNDPDDGSGADAYATPEKGGSLYLYAGYRYEMRRSGGALGSPQANTGWYYCWNRMYDPLIGRWTSPDPAASPWSNLWDYGTQRPTAFRDSSGLSTISGHAMTLAWIPRGSLAGTGAPDTDPFSGRPTDDPDPPIAADMSLSKMKSIIDSHQARYSNYLHAWIESNDGATISDSGFAGDSDGYYASEWIYGIGVDHYAPKRDKKLEDKKGCPNIKCMVFRQVVNSRSTRPDVVGNVIGGVAGIALWNPFLTWVGGAFARWLTNLPPIWSNIELKLCADGTQESMYIDRSWFPKLRTYYAKDGPANDKTFDWGSTDRGPDLQKWKDSGWGSWDGHIWGAQSASNNGNPDGIHRFWQ